MSHYDTLGVDSTASATEIRAAYRTRARLWHPDRADTGSAARMAELNEAYRVLSDPGRRAVYDRERLGPQVTYSSGSQGSSNTSTPPPRVVHPPARFPWRFMLVMATLGITFVLVNAAFMSPATERPIDVVARPGSCVTIEPNGDARVVRCSGQRDLVVQVLVPASQACPLDTTPHRDAQGLGTVCVRRAGS